MSPIQSAINTLLRLLLAEHPPLSIEEKISLINLQEAVEEEVRKEEAGEP